MMLAIVLLAAGEGARYGGIKQLALIDNQPMIRRTARTLCATGLDVVVVTGAHAPLVEAALADLPLHIVHNPDWAHGMGGSIACGIAHLMPGNASGALICLGDQPLLQRELLIEIIQRHARAPARIVACDNGGQPGPPVLFPRDLFNALLHFQGTAGAQALLRTHGSRVDHLAQSAGIDVDTPIDLNRAQHQVTIDKR